MRTKTCTFFSVVITVVSLLTFVSQAGASYEDEVMADDPLLFYRFGDANMNDGATITDLGSAGVIGTYKVSGTSFFSNGDGLPGTGEAVYWHQTGDGDVYMITNDSTEALSYSDITVEAWVRVRPEQHSPYMRLFTSGGDWLNTGSPGISLNQPYEWAMMGGDNTQYGYEAPTEDGNWHHVVGLWDSGASTAKTLYVDGVLVNTLNGPNDLHFDQSDAWMIGCEGNIYWHGNLFHGDLDEFAIYEGLLSEDRIVAHYVAGVPEPATLVLLGLGGLALIRKRRV
jgi:hypothetical protein